MLNCKREGNRVAPACRIAFRSMAGKEAQRRRRKAMIKENKLKPRFLRR